MALVVLASFFKSFRADRNLALEAALQDSSACKHESASEGELLSLGELRFHTI